jgi:uncharacterized protein with PhoU and TrkA domain
MKNISELMIDLAYSSLFLQDKTIANEVLKLHEKIKLVEKDTLKHIFKIRESAEERIKIIDMMDYVKDIANAAFNMCDLIKKGEFPQIIEDVLEETEERVITATINKNSVLCDKTIGEIKLRTFTRVNVISIKRGDKWIFNIDKKTLLKEGDFLVGVGTAEGENIFKKTASGKIKRFV